MAGKKRTRNGQVKPASQGQEPQSISPDISMTDPTPPCAQPQLPSSTSTESPNTNTTMPPPRKPEPHAAQPQATTAPAQKTASKPKTRPRNRDKREPHHKLQKLPPNTTISRRPLLHPALPTPFASASAPKILYIKASTPYIPALKRIRRLLDEISKRGKQSLAAKAKAVGRRPGSLRAGDVEREIVSENARAGGALGGDGQGEKVYLKATGRAIPRALELGVRFQGEADCVVRVEMGSVKAIDDIEVRDTDEDDGAVGGGVEVPETRIRTVSSVTVSIGLK